MDIWRYFLINNLVFIKLTICLHFFITGFNIYSEPIISRYCLPYPVDFCINRLNFLLITIYLNFSIKVILLNFREVVMFPLTLEPRDIALSGLIESPNINTSRLENNKRSLRYLSFIFPPFVQDK